MQASIGQMAASVACNINDLIEFVKSNLNLHRKYASDIKALLNQAVGPIMLMPSYVASVFML